MKLFKNREKENVIENKNLTNKISVEKSKEKDTHLRRLTFILI